MFDEIHRMRSRIITSPAFNGSRILGAILFEMTMDRQVEGVGTAEYLWDVKQVVPFLKVDKGLADEVDGASVMKPIPDLDALLDRAVGHGVFGTKMRSVIKLADPAGVKAVVDRAVRARRADPGQGPGPHHRARGGHQQPQKQAAEDLLRAGDRRPASTSCLPTSRSCSSSPFPARTTSMRTSSRIRRCCGWWRSPAATLARSANARLARNHGVIASSLRALTEGLTAQQSDAQFNDALDAAIESIYEASIT
jgi:fructose-bisphosphate aldolase class I